MSVGTKKTILLVEDEVIIALTEKMSLERYGYTVITASTGEKAIETIEKIPGIDLILMDINLGSGIDGTEAAEIILRKHDLPILFLSSHTEREIVEKTEGITSYGYVVKSSSITVLDAAIKMAGKLFDAHIKKFEMETALNQKNIYLSTSNKKMEAMNLELAEINKELEKSNQELVTAKGTLLVSEDKFRKAFMANPDSIVISRISDGIITSVNKGFTKLTGYTEEEVVGKTSLDINSWKEPDDRRKSIEEFTTKGKIRDFETQFLTKHREIFGSLSSSILELNGVPHILTIIRDITDRKLAEHELQESEKRFNLALEGTDAGVWDWDMVNDSVTYSKRWKSMLGYDDHEVEDAFSGWKNLWHPDDCASIENAIEDYLAGKTDHYEIIHRLRHKNGEWRWILTRGEIVKDVIGKPVRWVGTNLDITDRKRAEEAISELKIRVGSQELYSVLVEKAYDGFWLLDKQFTTLYVNPAMEVMLGYTRKEMIGKNWYDFGDPEWVARAKELEKRRETGVSEPHNFLFIHKCGKKVMTRIATTPLYDTDGNFNGALGIVNDITRQKEAEDALKIKDMLDVIAKSSGLGMSLINPDYTISWHNDLQAKWFGTLEKTKGRNCFEVFDGRKVICTGCPSRITFATGEVAVTERTGITSSVGVNRIFSITTSPIRDTSGNVIQVVEIVQDITDRKHAEKTLRESEIMFSSFMDYLPAIAFLKDNEGRTLFVNKYMATAVDASQWLGKTMRDVFPNEFGEKLIADDMRVMKLGYQKIEESIPHLDGKLHNYETQKFVIDRPDQEPLLGGISLDITDRKRMATELQKKEERILLLLNSTAEAIYGIDKNGNCTFCNSSCLNLLRYKHSDDLLGKNMHFQIHGKYSDGTKFPVEECRIFQAFKKGVGTHVTDEVLWRSDGTSFPAEYWSYPQLEGGEIVGAVVTFLDITERKKAEDALRESEKRLQDIYKLVNIGIWEWKADTDIVTWSDELYRIADLDPMLPALNFAEHSTYFSPESWQSLKTAVERTMETGEPYQLDLKLIRSDGTIRNVIAFGGVKYDNNGRTIGLYGSVQDITDQKQVEEALRESEKNLLRQTNLFSSLLENLPIGVFMVEAPSGKPLVANEAATDVLGRGILPHVVKDNLSEVYNSFKAGTHDLYPLEEMPIFLGMTGKTSHIDDMVVERPDGTQSPLEVFGSPVMDEQGQVWASIVSFLDITERKRAEQVLRDIIDKNPMSIQIIDKKGFVLKVNSAHTKLFGAVPPSNYSVFNDFQLEEQGFGKLIERAKNGEIVYFPDFYYNAHDLDSKFPDVPVWIRMVTFPLFDSYGKPERFVTMQENITERKVAEEKIKALLAEKELILKEVHHRIKNNMNTIKGFLHLQVSTLKNPSAMAALKDAESRVHSMMVLYDKLYKADSFNDVSVKDYFPALVDQIIGNFPNSTLVKIENHVDDFMIDAKRLSSLGIIVNELLTNIMKYAFTGRSAGLITVSASLKGNRVYFIIADNGNGMPKSIDFENSTGFGLMLVEMLTKQIGGSIRIERENGTQIILEFEN